MFTDSKMITLGVFRYSSLQRTLTIQNLTSEEEFWSHILASITATDWGGNHPKQVKVLQNSCIERECVGLCYLLTLCQNQRLVWIDTEDDAGERRSLQSQFDAFSFQKCHEMGVVYHFEGVTW